LKLSARVDALATSRSLTCEPSGRLQQDNCELSLAFAAAWLGDRRVELLVCTLGAAELAPEILHVLRLQRRVTSSGVREARELVRVEPDAHGVLRAEHAHVPTPLTADRILDVGNDVVAMSNFDMLLSDETNPTTIRTSWWTW